MMALSISCNKILQILISLSPILMLLLYCLFLAPNVNKIVQLFVFTSRLELKIRWEVLDWSAYHAAAVLAAVHYLRLNISVAIDSRRSKSKFGIYGKEVFFYYFFPPRPIKLIVNQILFKTTQFKTVGSIYMKLKVQVYMAISHNIRRYFSHFELLRKNGVHFEKMWIFE